MGDKIKVEMFRYGTLVFGRVLEMDESIRESGTLAVVDQDDWVFKLSSVNRPELKAYELFVRGSMEKHDDKVFQYNYPDEEGAIAACKAFKRLVDKVNADAAEDGLAGATDIKRVMP
jgi:hypothetical protein